MNFNQMALGKQSSQVSLNKNSLVVFAVSTSTSHIAAMFNFIFSIQMSGIPIYITTVSIIELILILRGITIHACVR